MAPVDILFQITKIDSTTNELELAFVSAAVCEWEDTGAAISKWFKEVYPSRTKENCMLKNGRAFERLVELRLVSPEPCIHTLDRPPVPSSMPAETQLH